MGKIILTILLSMITTAASAQNTLLETMADYTEFATYDAGIIVPAQITDDLFSSFTFVDTRSEEEFAESTIEGAIHIEWRDVFSRIEDIPKDKKTILFCNTGALSAQVVFGLRVLGFENLLILQGGYEDWRRLR
ncbi:rhodanese-like domain-containing protein [Sulfitobacter sp. SK012]|uniref:rhodanese-like domain-containing protein n=1 Tax=Sulfitobacter sp. SK012 TaxID=1389005 RepID=UPI0020C769B1|nr:rhodanese-like domain-containing protein [Sulfitobacter sp. SK012]